MRIFTLKELSLKEPSQEMIQLNINRSEWQIHIKREEIEFTNKEYYNPISDLNDMRLIKIPVGLWSCLELFHYDNKIYTRNNDWSYRVIPHAIIID